MIFVTDPGKQVGFSMWSNDGVYKTRDEVPMNEFYDTLEMIIEKPEEHTFVVEDFRLDPNTPQGGSKMEACQVIGAVTFASRLCEAELILQPPKILFMAQKWSGIKVPAHGVKNHDANSAYNHGIYYMVNAGIIKNPAHSRIVRISGN